MKKDGLLAKIAAKYLTLSSSINSLELHLVVCFIKCVENLVIGECSSFRGANTESQSSLKSPLDIRLFLSDGRFGSCCLCLNTTSC